MPEAAEVSRTTKYLADLLVGKTLLQVTANQSIIAKLFKEKKTQDGSTEYQKLLDFLPCKVINVFCKGKYIFFEIYKEGCTLYFHSHLRMTGVWTLAPAESKMSFKFASIYKLDGQTRTSKEVNIYYKDRRILGKMAVYTQDELDVVIDKLGLDVLQDEITMEKWLELCQKCKNRQINSFLMSQDFVCGIGNYLKAEILYEAKIKPDRKVGTLSLSEKEKVLKYVLKIPRLALESNGLTISDFELPDGGIGTYEPKVYKQLTDPDGHEVTTDKFADGRTTHWCPAVQN